MISALPVLIASEQQRRQGLMWKSDTARGDLVNVRDGSFLSPGSTQALFYIPGF